MQPTHHSGFVGPCLRAAEDAAKLHAFGRATPGAQVDAPKTGPVHCRQLSHGGYCTTTTTLDTAAAGTPGQFRALPQCRRPSASQGGFFQRVQLEELPRRDTAPAYDSGTAAAHSALPTANSTSTWTVFCRRLGLLGGCHHHSGTCGSTRTAIPWTFRDANTGRGRRCHPRAATHRDRDQQRHGRRGTSNGRQHTGLTGGHGQVR